jgi:hypothetical protein
MLTAVAGAGMLGFSVALNALSDHATCTVVFVIIAAVINFAISSLQTLNKIAWIGWFGLFGIMSSGEGFTICGPSPQMARADGRQLLVQ